MARKQSSTKKTTGRQTSGKTTSARTSKRRRSALLDTRIVYCGDCLDKLAQLPDTCVDLIYIDPPFNSNRNYEVFWGETKEKPAFEDRHASTAAYIDYMRPRCVKVMFDPIGASKSNVVGAMPRLSVITQPYDSRIQFGTR